MTQSAMVARLWIGFLDAHPLVFVRVASHGVAPWLRASGVIYRRFRATVVERLRRFTMMNHSLRFALAACFSVAVASSSMSCASEVDSNPLVTADVEGDLGTTAQALGSRPTVYLRPRHVAGQWKCLDVEGWSMQDGARVQSWDCVSGTNQRFGARQDQRRVFQPRRFA